MQPREAIDKQNSTLTVSLSNRFSGANMKQGNHSTPPHWDVSNVYPGLESPEFLADNRSLSAMLETLERYLGENQVGDNPQGQGVKTPAKLASLLDELVSQMNDLLSLAFTLRSYISAFVSTDSYNVQAKKAFSTWEKHYVRLQKSENRIQAWIGSLGSSLEKALELAGTARDHAFALLEIAEQSRYMMSQAEEALAADLGLSGAGAWSKLQGTITSQLSVDFELDGETKKLPMPALINLRNHPDEPTRRRAYEAELAAWETIKEPIAAALNGVKGYVITLNQRRGREDALHSAIDQARIDRATLEAMLAAMKDSFPKFRQYYRAKARRLGKEKLAWWDLYAPVGAAKTRYAFPQAADFILTQFNAFSPALAAFARKAFEQRWVDAEMRDGKRGGAFCMTLPRVKESRVLCNFDGSLDSVFTLAHELGHGYHNWCKKDKTMLQQSTPMTLAETASIMCETIVFEATIEQTSSPEERLAILETSLVSDAQVIVDIYSRYLFEKEVFERRAENELTAEEFCEIMTQSQLATYGDSLDERHLHKYMWVWKPHYYRPGLSFYNFPYAFGLLFGIGLYAIYQEKGASFIPEYNQLLESTGESTAADLASRFGIDIRQPAFWQNSLRVIGNRIDHYLNL
jgi:pepF/M3 family oligoendopeptidase